MSELSIEARVVAGGFWGTMMPGEVRFQRPHIIHERTRKGLDDLVEAGFLTVDRCDPASDTLVWRPTDKMRAERPGKVSRAFMEANSFPVTDER